MEDRNIPIVHQFLNREIDLDELKQRLSEEDFAYWKSTLQLVDELPKPAFHAEQEFALLLEKKKSKRQNPWRFKLAIAAVFLIFSSLLVVNYFTTEPEFATYSYQSDLKENIIILPDSSKVWLNQGATISYNAADWATHREIQLEGEAYFDVKKGQRFTVHSKLGTVTVLGTTFTVSERKAIFSVACYTGKVAVTHAGNEVILKAKQAFSGETNQVSQITTQLPDFVGKWTLYEKTPLIAVVQELEQKKQIKIALQLDKEYLFTGGYSYDMTAEEIVALISQSLGVRYKKIDTNHYEMYSSSTP
jgi:ferric-dicitrate binding protein FerR (iron transport regulator)